MDYLSIMTSPSFFLFLLLIDRDIAAKVKEGRCPICGEPLDVSNFKRKMGFGIPPECGEDMAVRLSFCCRECRRRQTPPSARFLPGKCYLTVIVAIMAIMQNGENGKRMKPIQEKLGISRQTIGRWRRWWRDEFTMTPFWRESRGRFSEMTHEHMPTLLLKYYEGLYGDHLRTLIGLCAFVAPYLWSDRIGIYQVIQGRLSTPAFAQTSCGAKNFIFL